MGQLPKSRPKRTTPVRERAAGPRKRAAAKARSRRPSPPSPGRASTERDPAVFGPDEHAPGLPRLALDGAIEAAKLPVKVGANLTFRALDAVTKGLRGR